MIEQMGASYVELSKTDKKNDPADLLGRAPRGADLSHCLRRAPALNRRALFGARGRLFNLELRSTLRMPPPHAIIRARFANFTRGSHRVWTFCRGGAEHAATTAIADAFDLRVAAAQAASGRGLFRDHRRALAGGRHRLRRVAAPTAVTGARPLCARVACRHRPCVYRH